MTAVHFAYSRSRVIFRGISTVFLMMVGFFLLFTTASRVPGISEISDIGIANADAPVDSGACADAPIDASFSFGDPGCGCGCGCGY